MSYQLRPAPQARSARAMLAILAVAGLLAIAFLIFQIRSAGAFTPGSDGHPTNGPYTNLQGFASDVTLTFEPGGTLLCVNGVPSSFTFTVDYTIKSGVTLPAGSVIIVYLSPNNGAINGNADTNNDGKVSPAEATAYIQQVESNYFTYTVPVGGLTGSGSFTVTISTTSFPFTLNSGGVLGVIADDKDGTTFTQFTSKSASLNCTEAPTPTATVPVTASPTPTPTPSPTPTPTPSPTPTPTPSPTPTPTPSPTPTPTPPTQGCSPGFFLHHTGSDVWGSTLTTTTLGSVFTIPVAIDPLGTLSSTTFLDALSFQGGSTTTDAAQILLRQAVAAYLNLNGSDPTTLIAEVNTALAGTSGDMLALAEILDTSNNLEGPTC